MYKLMNWNTIEYFEEKEDCLEACLTATLDLYKQDWNKFAKEKDLPYTREVDEIEEDPCWFDDIDD